MWLAKSEQVFNVAFMILYYFYVGEAYCSEKKAHFFCEEEKIEIWERKKENEPCLIEANHLSPVITLPLHVVDEKNICVTSLYVLCTTQTSILPAYLPER